MRQPDSNIMHFLNDIGAAGTSHHAGRSLSEHLLSTWNLLSDWELNDAVRVAGLCHSVYGTDAFDTACLQPADRPRVIAVIGEKAENVSFVFGAMQREDFLDDPESNFVISRFDQSKIKISNVEKTAICDILLANEMDLVFAKKGKDRPDKVLKKVGPVYSILEPYLSKASVEFYQNAIIGA